MHTLLQSPALQNSGKKTLTAIFAKHQESATADVVNSAMKKAGIKKGPLRAATASGTLPKFGGGASNADLATFAEALRAAAASKDPYLSPSYAAGLLAQVEAEQARRADLQARANATESTTDLGAKAKKNKQNELRPDLDQKDPTVPGPGEVIPAFQDAVGPYYAGWKAEWDKDPITAIGHLNQDASAALLAGGPAVHDMMKAHGLDPANVLQTIAKNGFIDKIDPGIIESFAKGMGMLHDDIYDAIGNLANSIPGFSRDAGGKLSNLIKKGPGIK
jgi:hypothetical protein